MTLAFDQLAMRVEGYIHAAPAHEITKIMQRLEDLQTLATTRIIAYFEENGWPDDDDVPDIVLKARDAIQARKNSLANINSMLEAL